MSFISKLLSISVLAAGALALTPTAQAKKLNPLPMDTAVKIGTLPNGLTYYIRHSEVPKGSADFFLAQKVGSIEEEENQRGLAHFLEHMAFNGSKHFPGNSVISYLETIGVKFGQNLNAYTSTDETVYNICEVPTARFSSLDSCVMILSEWSHGLTLDKKEIDAERGVIKGEWRQRQGSASNRLLEKAAPSIYPGSKYGHRMPIGLMEVVETFSPKELRDYYNRWYYPKNQGVIIVGDFDTAEMEKSIKKHFANIKTPKNAPEVPTYDVPDNEEIISAVLTDPEQAIANVMLIVKHDGLSDEDSRTILDLKDDYTRMLVMEMLRERLNEGVDEASSPLTRAFARDGKFMLSGSKKALTIAGFPKDGKLKEATAEIAMQLKRAAAQGFMPAEFERAKLTVGSAIDNAYASRSRTTNTEYANQYVRHFLDGGSLLSDEMEHAMLKGVRNTTKIEDANAWLRNIVGDGKRNTIVLSYLPESFDMAGLTGDDLGVIVAQTDGAKAEPYADKAISGDILAQEPEAGTITKEENLDLFGAKIYHLSNGIKVYAKRTDFGDDRVIVSAWSPGGASVNYTAEDAPNYKVINDVLAVTGFGGRSAADNKKLLAGKQVRTGIEVGNMDESLVASTTPADMTDAFRMLYLKATAATPDTAAFANLMDSKRMQLTNRANDPTHAMGDTIHTYVFDRHPLVEKVRLNELEKVDYARILDIHKDRFGDMSDFTFTVVGNFDEDSLRNNLCRYVASLPGNGRMEKARDIGYRYAAGNQEYSFKFPMKVKQSVCYSFYNGECDYNLSNALHAKILGQILSSRLLAEIREKRGLTYGIKTHCGINGGINGADKSSFLMPVYVRVSAGHEQECRDIVRSEIARLATEPVTDEELLKIKQYMLKEIDAAPDDNQYWASILRNYVRYGQDMHTPYKATVEAITPQTLMEFASKHFPTANRLELTMTPE